MTRGKQDEKSAARIARSKPGVSWKQSEMNVQRLIRSRERSPERRTRLPERLKNIALRQVVDKQTEAKAEVEGGDART